MGVGVGVERCACVCTRVCVYVCCVCGLSDLQLFWFPSAIAVQEYELVCFTVARCHEIPHLCVCVHMYVHVCMSVVRVL